MVICLGNGVVSDGQDGTVAEEARARRAGG